MAFENPRQLTNWLAQQKIDTTQWGQGTAKSIDDLWHELNGGDSQLDESPLLRRVNVVTLLAYQNDWQLIEAVQTFADGRQRFPNRAPSEKVMLGESPSSAAVRCLQEEVGATRRNLLSPPSHLKTEQVRSTSPSYPTLPTEFTFYTFRVELTGLPNHNFVTHNQATNDPVRSIRWTWIRSQETPS